MKRILIIGSPGSGKSTLSRQLGRRLDLPVIHLDAHYWNAGWVPTPNEQWDEIVDEFTGQDQWIIDGNYSRTMDRRIKRADAVLFMDMPRILCLYRVVKRRIQHNKGTRPDMNAECEEKIDGEFIKWVWGFGKNHRPDIIRKLDLIGSGQRVIHLKTRKEVKAFLTNLESKEERPPG